MSREPHEEVEIIFNTLVRFGVRLPAQYDDEDLDERISLMRLLSGHVAKALHNQP